MGNDNKFIKIYFGRYFQDPISRYIYTVISENGGYLSLSDVETGRLIKVKEEGQKWLDFIDVTDEIEKENKGIISESSGYENSSDFRIEQYADNIFEVENQFSHEKYKVVVGEGFDLDVLTIMSNNKIIVFKGEKLYKIQIAIQNHVLKYNPQSKKREIAKFLQKKDPPKQFSSKYLIGDYLKLDNVGYTGDEGDIAKVINVEFIEGIYKYSILWAEGVEDSFKGEKKAYMNATKQEYDNAIIFHKHKTDINTKIKLAKANFLLVQARHKLSLI